MAMCTRRKSVFPTAFPVARSAGPAPRLAGALLRHGGRGTRFGRRKAAAARKCMWSSAMRRGIWTATWRWLGGSSKALNCSPALPRGSAEMGFYSKDRNAAADQVHPRGGRRAGGGALQSRSDPHRYADIHGADRIAPQSARGVFQGSGRPHRSVQRADCRCAKRAHAR